LLIDHTLVSLLIAQIGVGGAGGFALGIVLRRITSLIIGVISFLFVMILVILGGLTRLGLQIISPESTEKFVVGVMETTLRGLLSASATVLPFGGSFSLGLCLGLLIGKPQSWL
jgi:uncharacterized membrane protein (Fun14 family)